MSQRFWTNITIGACLTLGLGALAGVEGFGMGLIASAGIVWINS